jgi:hypothetical protein
VEFWATADLGAPDLEAQLALWQTYYNWSRPHTSLTGKTPLGRFCELKDETPYSWEVAEQYEASGEAGEPLRIRDYSLDQRLCQLKR